MRWFVILVSTDSLIAALLAFARRAHPWCPGRRTPLRPPESCHRSPRTMPMPGPPAIPEQVAALYAEDGLFEEVVLGVVLSPAPVTSYGTMWRPVYAAFPDFTATPPRSAFASGNQVVIEWVLSGTYQGQFGTLPAGTGQTGGGAYRDCLGAGGGWAHPARQRVLGSGHPVDPGRGYGQGAEAATPGRREA